MSCTGDSVTLLDEPKHRLHLRYPESDAHLRKEFIGNLVNGEVSGKGSLSFHARPGYWLGHWKNGLQHGIQMWIDFDESLKEVLLEVHEFVDGVDTRTLDQSEVEQNQYVNEWKASKPSFLKYSESQTQPLSKFKEGIALDSLLEQSKAEYVLHIVLESGATVRTGVDIDKSPEVRKLQQGDIVEAFCKVSTDDNIQRFQLIDGYISERLRGANESLIAKTLRHLFPKPRLYKVTAESGAKVWSTALMEGESTSLISCGEIVKTIEIRYMTSSTGERTIMRLSDSSAVAGWIIEEDTCLCTKLLSPDLQAELAKKISIRQERFKKRSASQSLEMLSSKERKGKGSIKLSKETLFLLIDSHPDMRITNDFSSVTLTVDNTRALVLGSKGFSRGVHYWEVKVDQASYASGAVFIGVAPATATSWSGGYGFLNYRATQSFGSETLYGSYYNAGDIIGVILDMDRGTLSFVKEGEDFHVCKYITINMGVAYHNIRSRNKNGGDIVLYPCFGLKLKHDCVSIRKCSWLSHRGLGIENFLNKHVESLRMLEEFREYKITENLSDLQLQRIYQSYLSMHLNSEHSVISRPGIEVAIKISPSDAPSESECGGSPIHLGDTYRSRQGLCRIIGFTSNRIWFSVESCILGVWFWTICEFQELVSEGSLRHCEEETAKGLIYYDLPVDSEEAQPPLTEGVFRISIKKTWTQCDEESFVQFINEMSDRYNLNPIRIPPQRLLQLRRKNDFLLDISDEEIVSKYTWLTIVNKAASVAIPLIDFGQRSSSLLESELENKLRRNYPSDMIGGISSNSSKTYQDIKSSLFSRTKHAIWNAAMKETTTPTSAPGDEFDRPDDIMEFSVNRLEAKTLQKSPTIIPYSDKLTKSVLGQLMTKMSGVDDLALRRSYEDTMDDGQTRAFFIKLIGEGADDHGGPYRAIFQTAVSEEAELLLDLLVPCTNARHEVGENRDKLVFNAVFAYDINKLKIFEFFGKLIGIACRNNILVNLNLPDIVWKPLTNEVLSASDFYDLDVHLSRSLEWILSGEAEDDLLLEVLSTYVNPVIAEALFKLTKPVTPDTLSALCQLILHLNYSQHRQILAYFYKGLNAIVPCEIFSMFTTKELEVVFCGEPDINIELLQEATIYEGVSPTDEHIVFFWQSLKQLSCSEKSLFLNFCSGRSRLPSAVSDFTTMFKLLGPPSSSVNDPDHYLPIAQTCFFSLSVPRYSSYEICYSKLRYAILHTDLMDADFNVHNADGWENIRA